MSSYIEVANWLEKPSSKELQAMVLKLQRGEYLTQQEKDYILLGFTGAAPKAAKDATRWIIKPSDFKCMTWYMKYVVVQNGVATATDGHRVHLMPFDKPDGLYKLHPENRLQKTYHKIGNRKSPADELIAELKKTKSFYRVRLGDLRQVVAKNVNGYLNRYFKTSWYMPHFVDLRLLSEAANLDKGTIINVTEDGRYWWGSCEYGDFIVSGVSIE